MQPSAKIAKPARTARDKRMTLESIAAGRRRGEPVRILIYGVEGIGKSTLASRAPAPIFLGPEDTFDSIDAAHFPQPQDWQDVLDAVGTLITDRHEYRTLAVDTLDWIEPLLWKDLCEKNSLEHIEDFGYGKGYQKALDGWRALLSLLERLSRERRMHVLLLAHAQVKTWKNPEGEDFDRYMLKLHDKAGGLCREWCKAVLFANYETVATKDARTKRVKGVSTGARLLYTEHSAAYDAKNRYDLPPSLPLDWQELWDAISAGRPADPQALLAAIAEKVERLDNPKIKASVEARIEGHAEDAALLAQINDWLNGKLAQKEA